MYPLEIGCLRTRAGHMCVCVCSRLFFRLSDQPWSIVYTTEIGGAYRKYGGITLQQRYRESPEMPSII